MAALASVTVVLVGAVGYALTRERDLAFSDPGVPTDSSAGFASGKSVRIVTAANFASGGGCHDHDTDGCDLYTAVLDLGTGEVSAVTRVTSDARGEAFPQISRDGKTVTYTRFASSGPDDAMAADLATGASRVIRSSASHPFLTPDGTSVLLTALPSFALEIVSLAGAVGKTPLLIGAHEPHVSADGEKVSFYATEENAERGSGTAQAKVYLRSSGTTVDVSEADGTAHCFWSFDGASLYCNNRREGGIVVRTVGEDGTVGAGTVGIAFPSVADLAAVDAAFGDGACVSATVEYGSFCDATHVALSAACMVKSSAGIDQGFTRAVVADIATGALLPVGAEMAAAFGGSGSVSWTTACGILP